MMRSFATIAAAGLLLAVATPSRADIVVTDGNGAGNFTSNVLFKTKQDSTHSATGFSNDNPQPEIMTFTSADFFKTSAQGQATLSQVDSQTEFNELTITSSGVASAGFTRLILNINAAADGTVTFDANDPFLVNNQLVNTVTLNVSGSGQNRFLFTAINGEVLTTLSLTSSVQLQDVEQVRVDFAGRVGAVPELSTWGMFLVGFAGVGFLAYRRKNEGIALRIA